MEMTAIIIDDEKHCSESLRLMLEEYTPQVEVVAEANDPFQGLGLLTARKPDILFLDVEMPHLNGFDLLSKVQGLNFETIFTTAHDEFAVKAFKHNAIDYLLKPVDDQELIEAVTKAQERLQSSDLHFKFHALLNQLDKAPLTSQEKISLPSMEGLEFIRLQDIVRCESDGNYTHVILTNGSKLLVSRTLKEIEDSLPEMDFVRVHHSHLINLRHIQRYQKGVGGVLEMTNGEHVSVSRSKKNDFLNSLNK